MLTNLHDLPPFLRGEQRMAKLLIATVGFDIPPVQRHDFAKGQIEDGTKMEQWEARIKRENKSVRCLMPRSFKSTRISLCFGVGMRRRKLVVATGSASHPWLPSINSYSSGTAQPATQQQGRVPSGWPGCGTSRHGPSAALQQARVSLHQPHLPTRVATARDSKLGPHEIKDTLTF